MQPKHTIYLSMFCFLLAVLPLTGQEFVFVKKNKDFTFKKEKLEDSEKYKFAKKIYDDLYEARGDKRFQKPEFVMNRDESLVAWMDPKEIQIGLEEKAYDICASFGDQKATALAILLGHELTHYYEKHAWRSSFASDNDDLDLDKQLNITKKEKKKYDKIQNETQADYLGGFLAYSAGYPVFKESPDFLDKVYQAYFKKEDGTIQTELEDYPSLKDRKTLAVKSTASLEKLVEVFDMANFFVATKNYEEGRAYYKYILKEYQSRELYNNVGVAAVLEALDLFTETEVKYKFPIELDLNFGGKGSKGLGYGDEKEEKRKKLLREAIRHFDYALSLDDQYAPAYLNKACAYTLLEDYTRAQFYAEVEGMAVAKATDKTKTATDIKVLLGIIAARNNNVEKAGDFFEEAITEGSHIAADNKVVLVTGKSPKKESNTTLLMAKKEKIDGISLAEFKAALEETGELSTDYSITIRNTIGNKKTLFVKANNKNGQNSKMLIAAHGDNYFFFQMTGDNYQGETARNIKRNATAETITDRSKYKAPDQTLESTGGQILVYKNLVFFLKNNKLVKWCTYILPEPE